MVPQKKSMNPLMDLDQIVVKVKAGVLGLEGAKVGDGWEGYTDEQLKVEIYRKTGVPGYTVAWSYCDIVGHEHQFAKYGVTHEQIDGIVAQISEAAARAVSDRFVEGGEGRRDPAIAAMAQIRSESEELGAATQTEVDDWSQEEQEAHSDPVLMRVSQISDEESGGESGESEEFENDRYDSDVEVEGDQG